VFPLFYHQLPWQPINNSSSSSDNVPCVAYDG